MRIRGETLYGVHSHIHLCEDESNEEEDIQEVEQCQLDTELEEAEWHVKTGAGLVPRSFNTSQRHSLRCSKNRWMPALLHWTSVSC